MFKRSHLWFFFPVETRMIWESANPDNWGHNHLILFIAWRLCKLLLSWYDVAGDTAKKSQPLNDIYWISDSSKIFTHPYLNYIFIYKTYIKYCFTLPVCVSKCPCGWDCQSTCRILRARYVLLLFVKLLSLDACYLQRLLFGSALMV